jgi:hypothetical protein
VENLGAVRMASVTALVVLMNSFCLSDQIRV